MTMPLPVEWWEILGFIFENWVQESVDLVCGSGPVFELSGEVNPAIAGVRVLAVDEAMKDFSELLCCEHNNVTGSAAEVFHW